MKITTLGTDDCRLQSSPGDASGAHHFQLFGHGDGHVGRTHPPTRLALTALGDTADIGIFPGSTNTLDISPVTASFTWGAASGTITGALDWFNNPDGVTGLNLGFGSDRLEFRG